MDAGESLASSAVSEPPQSESRTPPSPSKLTAELSRRFTPVLPQNLPAKRADDLPELYLCEPRHDEASAPSVSPLEGNTEGGQGEGLVSKWRQKERLKTTAVALVVCLNIGVDPPDVIKISPCARLECWVDPLSMQAPKALDTIGKNLQAQYERWQPRAKYKMHLDPTSEDVKKLAISCRRNSKNERVLFHYNGHGVPRPTSNGEIWVFNKSYTQYIPLSIYDLQTWVGTPAIYVFDCSAAGQVLNSFKQFMFQRQQEAEGYTPGQVYPHALSQSAASLSGASSSAALVERPDPMRECILLCACSDREVLPQTPDLPADVFTSCLTTPIKVALRWFCSQSLLRHEGVTKELIDRIPGKQSDRKTPLGELNWIFTAITDTIAWNVLPRALFQKLFRQDLLVASLFRNFLLAERIMRGANCTPCAYPRLPPTHQHPMWQAWDMAAEMCLLQLPNLLSGEAGAEYHPSPFFAQQLTAFELWLEHGSPDKKPPEQLPIVLQVLLSQVHRLRALVLLGRFLDMGSWAVDLALSVGIFPYVLKLLQTTATDLRQTLVFIWAKIMAWDANAQVQSDLVKDGGQAYFMRHLESPDPSLPPSSRAQAAFVLASICSSHPKGQMLCAQGGLLQVCLNQLTPTLVMLRQAQSEHAAADVRSTAQLVKWLLLCLGKLWEGAAAITGLALRDQVQEQVAKLLCEDDAEIRAAAVFALGALIQAQEGDPPLGGAASPSPLPLGDGQPPRPPLTDQERMAVERAIACVLLEVVYDASPAVRCEVATSLARVAVGHTLLFQDAVHAHQRTSARIMRSSSQGRGLGQQHTDTSRSAPEGPATSANSSVGLPAGASAPPQQVAQPQKNGQATSADSAHSKGAAGTLPRSVARISSDDQIPSGGSPTSSASPGVRLRYDQAYEPVLHIGLEEAQLGGVFASADAARVGGGLYLAVVEALCTLATDPSPRVCAAGLAALRAANVELVELAPAGGGKHGAGTSHTPPAGSSSTPSSPPAAALTTTSTASTSSFLPRSWQAKAWRSGGSAPNPPRSQTPTPASSTGGGSVHSSPTASPSGSVKGGSCTTRAAFILRRTPDRGDQSHYQPGLQQRAHPHLHPSPPTASLSRQTSSQSVASTSGGYELLPPSAQHSAASLPPLSEAEGGRRSSAGGGKAEAIPSGAGALPRSAIYRSSCQRFTWPLLTQQGGRACELEGWGLHAPWATPPDPEKLLQRHRKREEDVARCAAVAADPKRARLRDTVLTVDTGSDRNTAIMMDPFKPLVTSVDGQGVVRVSNYLQRATVNRFHVVTGGPPYDPSSGQRCTYPPVSVTALFQLNEMHSSQLLTCAADGAVRVWRDYGARKGQRLASAWQAVLVSSQGTPSRPAVFEWSPQQGTLFAAGGRLSGRVYLWDVDREVCGGQLNCGAGGSTGGGGGEGAADAAALDHLCCSRTSPTLLAADCTGTVRIFDLRTNGVAGATQHLRGKLAGLVMEPGGREHQVVLGYPGGQLAFLDCRVMGGGSSNGGGEGGSGRVECGVWKTVEAHSKGPMTTLVCHHHAPLLATATAHQVVKVWSAGGEQVGVVRAHTSFLSQRIGPITCMAFSPYDLMLASGGVDPLVAVYCVEGKGGAGGGAQRSAPPSPVQQLPPPQQLLLPPPPAAAPPHGHRGPAHRASASSG